MTRYHTERASYLIDVLEDPERIIEDAHYELEHVPFDSVVGTGLSGALAVPVIARAFDVPFAIVRKQGESSHSPNLLEGTVGGRWLFVDDLIETGDTLNSVKHQVDKFFAARYDLSAEFIGSYLYVDRGFVPAGAEEL